MKIAPFTIYSMGVSASLVAVSAGLFGLFGNGGALANLKEAKMYAGVYDELVEVANKMPQATKRVDNAVKLVKQTASEWNSIVATRTPGTNVKAGGIDISVWPGQLVMDTKTFRNSVQRAVNHQVKRGGVTVVSCPTVPGISDAQLSSQVLSSYYNFPPLPFPAVIYDLGTVTVEGTYDQILANVRSYASMPNYLAVTDGLAFTGRSPQLRATYNLTIVGFIRGKEVFAKIPETAGASTSGFGGGTGPASAGMMGAGPMGASPSGAGPMGASSRRPPMTGAAAGGRG